MPPLFLVGGGELAILLRLQPHLHTHTHIKKINNEAQADIGFM
jgi:hypothetical protein